MKKLLTIMALLAVLWPNGAKAQSEPQFAPMSDFRPILSSAIQFSISGQSRETVITFKFENDSIQAIYKNIDSAAEAVANEVVRILQFRLDENQRLIDSLQAVVDLHRSRDCDFVTFFLGKNGVYSYAIIDSVEVYLIGGNRFAFNTGEFIDSYDLADFSRKMNHLGSVNTGVTDRSMVFMEIIWESPDCLLREAVKYLTDEKNIHRKNLFGK